MLYPPPTPVRSERDRSLDWAELTLSWADVQVEAGCRRKVTLVEALKNDWGSLGCPGYESGAGCALPVEGTADARV